MSDTCDADSGEMCVVMESKCDKSNISVHKIHCMAVEVSSSNKNYSTNCVGSYLELGFTWFGEESEWKPQCILCYEVLSNKYMKSAELQKTPRNKTLLCEK